MLFRSAKKNPGALHFGSSGTGTSLHLAGALLMSMTGVQLTHVPYKGVDQAVVAAISNETQIVIHNSAPMLPHVKAGRVRGIAVTTAKRLMALPDMPTVAEAGVPGYEVVTWAALCVPGRLADDIRDRLNKMTRDTLALPDVIAKIHASGAMPAPNSPEQMRQRVQGDIDKWKKVAAYAKIELS